MNEYATVEDIKKKMAVLINQGKGGYVVTCNDEYMLALKGDCPDVDDDKRTVDLGGYC